MNAMKNAALAAVAACALAGVSAQAATTTITFDANDPIGGLAAGATLGNQYASYGVTFSANAFAGPGGPNGSWASNTNMTIVSSTGTAAGALGAPSLVSGNLLRSLDDWLNENGDPSFAVSFATPTDFFSADFAGVLTPGSVKLFAYSGATLLGTSVGTSTGQFTLSFAAAAAIVTRVVITPGDYNDWVGVDNITFSPAAVPEASTYLMFIAGLAGIGFTSARGRRAVMGGTA